MPDRPQAAIYARISLAYSDDTTKTDEQERIGRGICGRRGWPVAAVFCDLSQSAWNRNRRRNQWDRMLEGFAAREFDAIVTYWGDRLARRPRDLEDLLDIAEERLRAERGRPLILASQGGEYNFANPDHRMMMRWEVARSCNESDTISRRKIAEYERLAAQGRIRPGGRRAFGFARDNFTHDPAEADIIRQAAAAVLAGRGLIGLSRQLARDGVTTTTGKPMSVSQVRRMLESPRTAGLMPDGQHRAAWQPVLDEVTWQAVRALLSAKQPFHGGGGNSPRHLLSGIARCGVCQGALHAGSNAAGRAYRCTRPHDGRVTRSLRLLDEYVTGYVVGRLNSPASEKPDAGAVRAQNAELDALQRGRQDAQSLIEDIAGTPGQDIKLLYRALQSYNSRIAELRDRARDSAADRLRREHAGITLAEFRALPVDVQRSLVRATARVTVLRSSKRGGGFRTEDVDIRPAARLLDRGDSGRGGEGSSGGEAADSS